MTAVTVSYTAEEIASVVKDLLENRLDSISTDQGYQLTPVHVECKQPDQCLPLDTTQADHGALDCVVASTGFEAMPSVVTDGPRAGAGGRPTRHDAGEPGPSR